MVKGIKRHAYGLWFLTGTAVLFAALAGWIGGQAVSLSDGEPPLVYTFDPDPAMTGWQEDGSYHIVGPLHIRENCDRRPLVVEAIPSPGASPVPMPWVDLDDRPRDESRGPSDEPLRLAVFPPEFFYEARVKTVHICPASSSAEAQAIRDEGGAVQYVEVRTTLHTIHGNVVERATISAQEAGQ